ncbi:hypothetical protein ACEWY4_015068 [Coilia grayii]|uniref:Receptor-type tyrosine-protein phosphatase C n=1 Tax=Coilia grayii TaxID=363190 RepID=A0ABD1JU82_9TELE
MAGLSGLKALLALGSLLGLATFGLTQSITSAAPAPPNNNTSTTKNNGTLTPTQPASTQSPAPTAPLLPKCADRNAFILSIRGGVKIDIEIIKTSTNGKTNTVTAPTPINDTSDDPGNGTSVTSPPVTTAAPPTSLPPTTPDPYQYRVHYTDVSTPEHSQEFTGSSFEITPLKPCTKYTFTVTGIINGTAPCQIERLVHSTDSTKQEDFTPDWDGLAKVMCFKSSWNLSRDERCFKSNASCEMMNYPVGPDKCNVTIRQHTPPVDDLVLTYEDKVPVVILWKNRPAECSDKNFSAICAGPYLTSEGSKPFQSYNCTGTYITPGFSRTNHTEAKIECGATVTLTEVNKSSRSITIGIQSNSSCQQLGVNFDNFTTECKNPPQNVSTVECDSQCHIEHLKPFTKYTCTVTPNYERHPLKQAADITIETYSDKPDTPGGISEREAPQNNALRVTCNPVLNWNGGKGHYHATLDPPGIHDIKPKETCHFTFEDLSYLTEYKISITAKNNNGNTSAEVTYTASTRYNDKAVIGILAFLIILTSIALLFVLYKIYILQKRSNNDHPDEVIPLSPNPLMTVEPIAAEHLLDVYKKKIADEGRLFLAEFQSIPRIFSNFTVKVAKNQENQAKNRYVDILPYDYNRVQLSNNGGEAGADYINASFIEGFKEQKKYIAAQGPKEETILDFWRMIWEQKSSIIVMVTRCEEGNRNKCAQYWPSVERETEIFGDFVLKIKKEDTCPDYIIRHLTIINRKDKSSEREVTHIQFTSWPDHGVPSEPHLLLKLRRRVNSFSNFFSGPIVVHCSAGVGRTGTYIGIDAMMESLEAEGVMDIYGCVVKMRRQRCLMVQVEAQYILIHQALIEFNQFGDTEIPLAELHSSISTLQQMDCDSDSTLLQVEFQRLPRYRNWRTFNTAVSEENEKKNRYSTSIPYDFNRVLVKVEEENSRESDQEDDDEDDYSSDEDDEEESTQYINASYVDGYWSPRSLIAAQGPMEGTIPEFWQMVYQKKIKNIVMLSKCKEGEEELCAEYWGQEKKTYKDISVEETASVPSPAYIKRTIQLQHAKRKDSRQVQQYQFQGWPEKGLPERPQDLVELIRAIKQSTGTSRADKSVPVVVHCQNGTTRTGIFCALWNILDSANTENLLDIFQVCKSLRKERQGMISNFEHYQFLYKAAAGAFPAQNGEVKQTSASTDSVQIVNEVPASTAADGQQMAEKEPVQAAQAESKEKKEEKEADSAAESSSLLPAGGASEGSEGVTQPGTANGPAITVEV